MVETEERRLVGFHFGPGIVKHRVDYKSKNEQVKLSALLSRKDSTSLGPELLADILLNAVVNLILIN